MQHQLQNLKQQSAELMAQADSLQKKRAELLPQAQREVPDLDSIRTKMVDSLADADEVARRELSKELTAAKIEAEAVQKAQNQLNEVVALLADIHRQGADLAVRIKPVQAAILESEARRLGAEYLAKAEELGALFVEVRELGVIAEGFTEKHLVPAFYKAAIQFEIPAPIMGMSATPRITVNAGNAGDAATIAAAAAAKQRAAELI
jgi:hypothetical protein